MWVLEASSRLLDLNGYRSQVAMWQNQLIHARIELGEKMQRMTSRVSVKTSEANALNIFLPRQQEGRVYAYDSSIT